MEILKEEVRELIRNYVNSLKIVVKEKKPQIESIDIIPSLPTEFPAKAIAYLAERGFIIDSDRPDHFHISVKRGQRPHARSEWRESILYPRFKRIKHEASEKG